MTEYVFIDDDGVERGVEVPDKSLSMSPAWQAAAERHRQRHLLELNDQVSDGAESLKQQIDTPEETIRALGSVGLDDPEAI